MSGASVDTLLKRMRYLGSRKACRAHRRILAIQKEGGLADRGFRVMRYAFRFLPGVLFMEGYEDPKLRDPRVRLGLGFCRVYRCIGGRWHTGLHSNTYNGVEVRWINEGHRVAVMRRLGLL